MPDDYDERLRRLAGESDYDERLKRLTSTPEPVATKQPTAPALEPLPPMAPMPGPRYDAQGRALAPEPTPLPAEEIARRETAQAEYTSRKQARERFATENADLGMSEMDLRQLIGDAPPSRKLVKALQGVQKVYESRWQQRYQRDVMRGTGELGATQGGPTDFPPEYAINTPEDAARWQAENQAWLERNPVGTAISGGGSSFLSGLTGGLSRRFAPMSPEFRLRTEHMARESTPAYLLFAGAETAGALLPIGRVAGAVERGVMERLISNGMILSEAEKIAQKVATPTALAIVGGASGAVEGGAEGAVRGAVSGAGFGLLAPAAANYIRANWTALPEYSRGIIAEQIGFMAAGRAIGIGRGHPITLKEVLADAVIGGVFGALGGKSALSGEKPVPGARESVSLRAAGMKPETYREMVRGTEAAVAASEIRAGERAQARQESLEIGELHRRETEGNLPINVAERTPEQIAEAEARQPPERTYAEIPPFQRTNVAERIGPQTKEAAEAIEDVAAPVEGRGGEQGAAAGEVGPPTTPPKATSLKRAQQDRERLEQGWGPEEKFAARHWNDEVASEAVKEIEKSPQGTHPGQGIVAKVEADPTSGLKDTQRAILLDYKTKLIAARQKAEAEGNIAEATEHANNLLRVMQAAATSARASARDLAFQAAMKDIPASPQDIEMRFYRAQGGDALTEPQRAKAKDLFDKYQAAQARISELETALAEKSAAQGTQAMQRAPAPSRPKGKGFGSKNRFVTKDQLNAALKDLGKPSVSMNPLADPAKWKAAVTVGGYYIEGGLRKFGEWAEAVKKAIGEIPLPDLRRLYADSRRFFFDASKGDAAEKIRARAEKGELPTNAEVQKIGELLIDEGITDLVPMAKEAHKIISEINPNVTYRDVLEAFSNYGVRRKLSKDEIKAKRRELQGQARELLKIEDMLKGDAPLASGWERQLPGELQREYRKIVNEMKKAGEWDTRSRSDAIKSAMDSVKTRLKNEMADLQRAINTRTRLPGRRKLEYDAEASALREQRNALKKTYDEIFGVRKGRTITDEQRVQIALKAIERSETELDRQIREGDLFPGKKPSKTPSDPRLEAARARRDALREERDRLRKIERPPKTPEQKALRRLQLQLEKRHERLKVTLETGEIQRRKTTPVKETPEIIDARAQLAQVNEQIAKAEFDIMMKNRHWLRKAYDYVIHQPLSMTKSLRAGGEFSWLERQGLFQLFSHPVMTLREFFRSLPSLLSQKPDTSEMSRGEAILSSVFKRESKQMWRTVEKMKADPEYRDAIKAGVEFLEIGARDRAMQPEEFQGRWGERIPFIGATGRQFVMQGNLTRLAAFKLLRRSFGAGKDPSPDLDRAIANFVNVTTGRAALGHGKLSAAIAGLGPFAWAPRWAVSRLQALTLQPLIAPGVPLNRAGLRGRAIVLKEYARTIGGLATVMFLAEIAGAETPLRPVITGEDTDTLDMKSADFLKVKVGEKRYDLLAGISQFMTLAARMISGKRTTLSGTTQSLRGDEYRGPTRLTELMEFGRKKLGPVPGVAANILEGENIIGEKTTPATVARDLTVPLYITDIAETLKEDGWPAGLASGAAAIIGVGIWVRDKTRKSNRKAKIVR